MSVSPTMRWVGESTKSSELWPGGRDSNLELQRCRRGDLDLSRHSRVRVIDKILMGRPSLVAHNRFKGLCRWRLGGSCETFAAVPSHRYAQVFVVPQRCSFL